LETVIITGGTYIPEYAFYRCYNIQNIIIPDGIVDIGNSAFVQCSGLESFTIPEGVTRIGAAAFKDCLGLVRITVPASVTRIEVNAFSGCLFNRVTFEDPAGWYCYNLTTSNRVYPQLHDAQKNATHLAKTYTNYIWIKE